MPSTACSNCKRRVGSSDISALATSLALALDSGARPEALDARVEVEEDGEAAAVAYIPAVRERVLNSADAREGIQSFIERRAAVFQGR